MKRRRSCVLASALALAVGLLGGAAPDVRAELSIQWYTIDGGGGTFSTQGDYALGGTVGQPDAGAMSGASFDLFGGFWLGGRSTMDVEDPSSPSQDEALVFRLMAGLPNPFSDETGILLQLPEPRPVAIEIYDHSGRLVRVLCEGEVSAGSHRYAWDGRSQTGHRVASGVYLVKVRAGTDKLQKRIILLR